MATMPLEFPSPVNGTPDRHRVDHCEAAEPHEYTHFHRQAWAVVICEAGSETLTPENLKSWMRLWGRLGAELFDRFWSGDEFVRKDMIDRARTHGGRRGEVLAERLSRLSQQRTEKETGDSL